MTTTPRKSSIRAEENDIDYDDDDNDYDVEIIFESRIFHVTRKDIEMFDSLFLNKLVHNKTPFSSFSKLDNDNTDNTLYVIIYDRNPDYFEAFFHVLTRKRRSEHHGRDTRSSRRRRFGGGGDGDGIPEILKYHIFETCSFDDGYYEDKLKKFVLHEADSWGVKERIEQYMYFEVPNAVCTIQRAYRKHLSRRKEKEKTNKKNADSVANDADEMMNVTYDLSDYRAGCYVRGTCWICGEERWGYRPSIAVNWNPYRNGVNLPRYPSPGVCESCRILPFPFRRVSKQQKRPDQGKKKMMTRSSMISKSNNQYEKNDGSIQLIIEGETFNLSQEEIILLDSDFLNKLIDPTNPFRCRSSSSSSSSSSSRSQQQIETSTRVKNEEQEQAYVDKDVYIINDRNAKYFDAFLKILCCGAGGNCSGAPIEFLRIFVTWSGGGIKWNQRKLRKQQRMDVLQEADFWGIRERIDHFVNVISVKSVANLIRRAHFHEKAMSRFEKFAPSHRRHSHHHRSHQRSDRDNLPRARRSSSSRSSEVQNIHCCICGVQSFWGHHYYQNLAPIPTSEQYTRW